MILEQFHCDRLGCESHAWKSSGLPGWVVVFCSDGVMHFCCWDCVLFFGANMGPTERVVSDVDD
jgi:hypothetical protein